MVFLRSKDEDMHAVDTATGTKKWSFATGGAPLFSPVLSRDGTVMYVVSSNKGLNVLCAIDTGFEGVRAVRP